MVLIMKWFFEDEKNLENLRRELESWLGTPFRHRTAVKGIGCDCLHMVAAVMMAVGAIGKVHIPPYNRGVGYHSYDDALSRGLGQVKQLEQVNKWDLMDGDIVSYQYGTVPSHVGIYFEGLLYHSVWNGGVTRMSPNEPSMKKRFAAYRVKI